MARWAPPLSPHLPDPKCCAQRVCTEPAIVTGCRQDVQPLDHGSRPLLPLLLELPHRGAELCSSSGFDAFRPTKGFSSRAFSFASCLVSCYHNLLLLWLSCSHAHRLLGSQHAGSSTGTGWLLSYHQPQLRARAEPAGGCFMGWQPSNHCQTASVSSGSSLCISAE